MAAYRFCENQRTLLSTFVACSRSPFPLQKVLAALAIPSATTTPPLLLDVREEIVFQEQMAKADVLAPAPVLSGIDKVFIPSLYDTNQLPWMGSESLPIPSGSVTEKEEQKIASVVPPPHLEHLSEGGFPQSPLDPPRGPLHIPGLPRISSGSSNHLIQSRILQAVLDTEMEESNAEKAFFVADLSVVYRRYVRWMQLLPEVEPFYGKQ